MLTNVTTMARDPWSDAHQVATGENLDAELSVMRRRLWVRRGGGLVLGAAAVGAVALLLFDVLDPDARLWRVSALWPSYSLMGLAFVLVLVGAKRTSGASRPWVGPDAFLSRTDRTWLRSQIAANRRVATERQVVVAGTARRMVVQGRSLPTYLGLTALYLSLTVVAPIPTVLVLFAALTVWMGVQAVREAVWSHRARRWLAQHA